MTCFLIGLICILIGGSTASGYPPFDPSVWLMMFGVGMIAPYFSETKQ